VQLILRTRNCRKANLKNLCLKRRTKRLSLKLRRSLQVSHALTETLALELTEEQKRAETELKAKTEMEKTVIMGLLEKLSVSEGKINSQINDKTMANARKDKQKVVKYGDEIDKMGKDFDSYTEKDPAVLSNVRIFL
jgi:hypothetical protein